MGQQVGNLRISHWPITWPIYLPSTMVQGQCYCASKIISNSHPFHSEWVVPPIPEIQQFQYFISKIQGQGQGWGLSWVSQHGSNIISTHNFFIPCQSAIPFLRYDFFLNLTLKIQGQGHGWGECWKSQHVSNILSTHIPFVPCQSAIPFLRYDFFKIWPWKSKVKVIVEVKVGSHKLGVTSYRLTFLSFNVNHPFQYWDTKFSKFDLENPRWRWNDNDVAQLQV